MPYEFDRPIDRRQTNDLKWRPEGLKGYLPIQVSENLIPMWIADMDLPCPDCLVQALRTRAELPIYGYCAPRPNYYQALQYWYRERHGLELPLDRISILPTVVNAINLCIRAFSEPGDHVILQQPVYEPFAGLIAKTGRVLVNNGLLCRGGRYTMDFDLLERQASDPKTKLLILCSPHNPVGRVWTREELAQLGDICKRHHVLVIADEIHSDIVFPGCTHTPFPLASDAPCVLCTSPGKTFNMAGLRIANIVIPDPELHARYTEVCDSYSITGSSTFGLEAVTAAYSPEGAQWLDELLAYLEGNLTLVETWCQEHRVPFRRPDGTYLCWLDLSARGLDDDAIQERVLCGQEVICVPGPWFGPGGEGHLRLNAGCTRATLQEALRRIALTLNA